MIRQLSVLGLIISFALSASAKKIYELDGVYVWSNAESKPAAKSLWSKTTVSPEGQEPKIVKFERTYKPGEKSPLRHDEVLVTSNNGKVQDITRTDYILENNKKVPLSRVVFSSEGMSKCVGGQSLTCEFTSHTQCENFINDKPLQRGGNVPTAPLHVQKQMSVFGRGAQTFTAPTLYDSSYHWQCVLVSDLGYSPGGSSSPHPAGSVKR